MVRIVFTVIFEALILVSAVWLSIARRDLVPLSEGKGTMENKIKGITFPFSAQLENVDVMRLKYRQFAD